MLALLAGVAFLAVGIVRFGQSSILLNVVHLGSGLIGIVLARAPVTAHAFLVGAGVGYLGLWLLGVLAAGGWIPVGTADNWLHFVLGITSLALSAAPRRL